VHADSEPSFTDVWQHIARSQQPIAEGVEEDEAKLAGILAEGTNKAAAAVVAAVKPAIGYMPTVVGAAAAEPFPAPYSDSSEAAAIAVLCFSGGCITSKPDSNHQSAFSALTTVTARADSFAAADESASILNSAVSAQTAAQPEKLVRAGSQGGTGSHSTQRCFLRCGHY
jgi:hypothetical protein